MQTPPPFYLDSALLFPSHTLMHSLPPWLQKRSSGLFLHPTSLPGPFPIGQIGPQAYQFIDFLHNSGFSYWQTCPINPTSYGDSPYQSPSSFAGNPYLIDLLNLQSLSLLSPSDLLPYQSLPHSPIPYGHIFSSLPHLLSTAFSNFLSLPSSHPLHSAFQSYKATNSLWLPQHSLFFALKDLHNHSPWTLWPHPYNSYSATLNSPLPHSLSLASEKHAFFQFLFHSQWQKLKSYAHSKNVSLIGDIPIFVSLDSSDVWANPHLFCLDPHNKPTHVAGVPPDYFSPTGQLWGNPLYDWPNQTPALLSWWTLRLQQNASFFDVLRLDHFRGFESYWAVPASSPNAISGSWLPGPGLPFFHHIQKHLPSLHLLAEDLGDITPAVLKLKEKSNLPGMLVLQFAFDSNPSNPFLPHNHHHNAVVYTGTHDNDTSLGWYHSLPPHSQDQLRRYFRIPASDISWDLIRAAFQSVAHLAIIPTQDLLSKDSSARLNTPGQPHSNWLWRLSPSELSSSLPSLSPYLKELHSLFNR